MCDDIKTSLPDWWVVQTKPRAENQAINELNNQGFITYCPMYRKESPRARQIQINTTPLFPRYVFIKANQHAKDTIHAIRSTYGVSLLIKVGEIPTPVPAKVIQNIKLIEAQDMNITESYFKTGDTVKIAEGLYHGLEAIFQKDDGLERVIVLLNILNKETPLCINKNQLSKV